MLGRAFRFLGAFTCPGTTGATRVSARVVGGAAAIRASTLSATPLTFSSRPRPASLSFMSSRVFIVVASFCGSEAWTMLTFS